MRRVLARVHKYQGGISGGIMMYRGSTPSVRSFCRRPTSLRRNPRPERRWDASTHTYAGEKFSLREGLPTDGKSGRAFGLPELLALAAKVGPPTAADVEY